MRKAVVSASPVLWMLLVAIHVQAQDRPRTTTELVQLAIQSNRDLLATRERVAEARGLLRRAGVRPNPTVEVDYGTGRPVGSGGDQDVSFSYYQPIELGGKRGKRLTIGEGTVAAAEAELADQTRQLIFQVKAQVADVRAAQARQAAFVEMMGTGRDSLRLTRARVEEGDAAALEGQLLGVEVARIEAQLATSRGALMAALLDLRRVVGFVGSEPLAVEDSPGRSAPEAVALEALKVQALATRPDLRAARIAEEQAAAELALVRAEGIPDLTASVTLARETNAFEDLFATTASGRVTPIVDRDKRVMVGLSIPLFLPGRNRGAVDAALARATGARLHREYMEVAVPQEVEAAYARWMAANQAVELFRSNVLEQHQQNLNVMREAYTLGHLRLIDVLNEQRRVLDTRLAYVDAETELAQAAADLERAVGTELP